MKRYSRLILPFIGALLLTVSCKKADYLTDSGVHDPKTPLSTYDYLKQHPWQLFDTLVQVIDKYNLKEEVNNSATFFAPTDYSIKRYLDDRRLERQATNAAADYSLDSLYKYITADSVRQYMFSEKLSLQELPAQLPQAYSSLGKTAMGVFKELQTANTYTERTNAPTYLLYLVKVRGTLDEPGTVPPASEIDIKVLCQTTGIQTANGAKTLHVLANTHPFVRF
ncbi:hypothetical protein V9K67_23820 [Paraflavisolibacter sp. H34]|uniref:hypothetical protein n=1 Tax=Huijunlia imazamoxiresistens TaxID=3127457 RepID=UPI003015A4B3